MTVDLFRWCLGQQGYTTLLCLTLFYLPIQFAILGAMRSNDKATLRDAKSGCTKVSSVLNALQMAFVAHWICDINMCQKLESIGLEDHHDHGT